MHTKYKTEITVIIAYKEKSSKMTLIIHIKYKSTECTVIYQIKVQKSIHFINTTQTTTNYSVNVLKYYPFNVYRLLKIAELLYSNVEGS